VEWVAKVIERQGAVISLPGQAIQADAEDVPLPAECCAVLFTDPPYYDAVPYSDLANFFLVWLRDLLGTLTQRLTVLGRDGLSPAEAECIWHRGQLANGVAKDRSFFEAKIGRAFREARGLVREDGICCVVFAHKTTEGWEAQPAAPVIRSRGRGRGRRVGVNVSDESLAAAREATTLDRVHAAMLLQAGGRTNALRALLKAEQKRGPEFLRLANALSALYPKGSEEKRLLDAMLLATLG
jgi:hypothetical protein